MDFLTKVVECIMEGAAQTEPCRARWVEKDGQCLSPPHMDPGNYYHGLPKAERTCIEGAFWLGAYINNYSWMKAFDILKDTKRLFLLTYGYGLRSVNDNYDNWTEVTNGRDEALRQLKDLME